MLLLLKSGLKLILEQKNTYKTHIIFASFGGLTSIKIFSRDKKMMEQWTKKLFFLP
jgi:hypothetical protein